jgi:hypothetical protein
MLKEIEDCAKMDYGCIPVRTERYLVIRKGNELRQSNHDALRSCEESDLEIVDLVVSVLCTTQLIRLDGR